MRGVLMAGGSGTRLHPLTKTVNKHLLPIFDKPLIYYPLTTLILAGIREIAIVTSPREVGNFTTLLGDGSKFGVQINYVEQDRPTGIAEGILLCEDFLEGHKVGFILGDNLFHGSGLGRQLIRHQGVTGAHIFAYQVSNPESYGIIELDEQGKILNIFEKPQIATSNLAITGLYFYDETVINKVKSIAPSARGELEITDLNLKYLEEGTLSVTQLSQGVAWLDTGTFQGLHDASSYIRIVEERQKSKIGDPLEAARIQGWI